MAIALFLSEATLKERGIVNDNTDMKVVRFAVQTSQEMYIHPILGTELYERLQTGINNNNLNANETVLIDTYITNALIYYTLSELPIQLSYKFFNKGLSRKLTENTENPTMSEMIDIMNHYKNRAEMYESRLVKYLKESDRTNKYPEYRIYTSRLDSDRPRGYAYSIPVYLGLDTDTSLSYSEMYQGGSAANGTIESDATYIVGATNGAPTAGSFVWSLPSNYQGKRIRFYRQGVLQPDVDVDGLQPYYSFNNSSTPSITVYYIAFGDEEVLKITEY